MALALLAGCGDEPTPPTQPGPGPACANGAEATDLAALYDQFATEIHPMLARSAAEGGCTDCHGPGTNYDIVVFPDANQTMDQLWVHGYLSTESTPKTLIGALGGDVPVPMPLGSDRWAAEDVTKIQDFACALEASGHEPPALCEGEPDVGTTPIRRLSNDEYDNTVRDTVGDPTGPSGALPADDFAHGFPNVGLVQQFAQGHLEAYQDTAERLARETLLIPEAIANIFEAETLSAFYYHGGVLENYPPHGGPQNGYYHFQKIRAYVTTGLTSFPYDGTYTITVRARGLNAHHRIKQGEDWVTVDTNLKPLMRISVGGVEVALMDVPGVDGGANGPTDYVWGDWSDYVVTVPVDAGPQSVRVWLENVHIGGSKRIDVQLDIDTIDVSGPEQGELPPVDQARIDKFLLCNDATAGCVDTVVANALSTLWRRPATSDEIARYGGLIAETELQGDSFKRGVELVLEAAMTSPNFVFRPEIDPDLDNLASHPLDPYELATRLSYFIWSSTPDQELIGHAADGTLAETDVLAAQVDRMLADPKAVAILESFAARWLGMRDMEVMSPNAALFPDFDEELRAAMIEEVRLLFKSFLDEDKNLLDIVDTDYTFVNDRLAAHYGLTPPGTGNVFTKVSVGNEPRGGLLATAGMLTLTSHPNRTSPTVRGKWLLDQMLCQPPADPPPDVLTEVDPPEGTSLKEVLEAHAQDPACAACHKSMDALGLALENFGPLGKWRTMDDFGMPVDPTGELPDGQIVQGYADIATYLKSTPAFSSCVTKKMAIYAFGREPEHLDQCGLDSIESEFAASGYTVKGLIKAVVLSPLFRQRRPEKPGEFQFAEEE